MRISYRPKELWLLVFAVLALVPAVALNFSVLEKAPVWRIFTNSNLEVLSFLLLWILATCNWVYKARWRGFWSVGILGSVILYGNVYFLIRGKNYGLAFFSLGLLVLFAFITVNLYQVLLRPYYHSGRRWYEAAPRFIPHLSAVVMGRAQEITARVCRLDAEGCFLFTESKVEDPQQVTLYLGQHKVACPVHLVGRTKDDGCGVGMIFQIKNPDDGKDLLDFIYRIRSFGYA